MTQETSPLLAGLSGELADVVERVAASVVRVDDGTRLTASGTVWSADGIIVTTSHGVEQDENLAVELADGTRLAATLIGRDHDTDIALLKASATDLAPIARAAADDVKVGHLVLALGRPGDTGLHATIGIISARLDSQTDDQPEYVLHTDAVLYPGFSGGPLVNVSGALVGLNNLVFGRGRGVALGTPTVEHIAQAVLAHGRVLRGYLGIRMQIVALPASLRGALQLAQEHGLLIVQVEPGSPAEQAGVLLGDTLLSLNDRAITDVDELRHQLRSLGAGEAVTLRLLRAGQLHSVGVTLAAAQ